MSPSEFGAFISQNLAYREYLSVREYPCNCGNSARRSGSEEDCSHNLLSGLDFKPDNPDLKSENFRSQLQEQGAEIFWNRYNLNIQCSETLVGLVAKACDNTASLSKKVVQGVMKSVAIRQAFLSDLSHRIRFVYTPKHSSWLNRIELVFGVIIRKVIRRGSFRSVKNLRDKLVYFIDYFNRVFAHPFRWTYTDRPLMAKPAA